MKSLKKQIPAILYATMLLTITALCIVITNNTAANAFNNNTNIHTDKNNIQETSKTEIKDPDANVNDTPVSQNIDFTEEPVNPKPIVKEKRYTSSVPRNPEASEDFLYTQKIYGNSNTYLHDVFQTSLGLFVIVTTDSTEGDVSAKTPCTGIVKLDSSGNVLSALSLSYDYTGKYVTANLSPLGIIIITMPENESFYYINIVSYDFSSTVPYRINKAESAKVIPTEKSFLIFAEYSNECMVYSFNGKEFSFRSLGQGMIKELFEYGNHYLLFLNNYKNNSHSVVKISKSNLSVLSEITTENSVLEGIFPICENSTQNFIVFENSQGIYAKKYDSSFTKIIDSKKIGNFEIKGCYQSERGILLVCNGNISGVTLVTNELCTYFTECSLSYHVEDILDTVFTGKVLHYLAINDTDMLSLVYSSDNISSARYFDIKTKNAKLIYNLNNTFTLIYQNESDISLLGLSEFG